jgi:RNA polymerase sigma-70 factor (ECF subfamily)
MQPEFTSHRPSLECFRSYVVLLARSYWNPRLQGKLDPSDIVQQTLTQAWQGLDDFRGETDAEFRAWLRRILTRCQADFVRGFARDKRALARECSLDAMVTDSSARLEAWLDDQQSSPQERAERDEQLVQLADALAELPEAQQEAIVLHHLHGLSISEIGLVIDRTPVAVAGLLKRGLRTLREQFESGG